MKKKIAITGGIGSGKSSVLRILEEMGYPIFSCDEIYRQIVHMPAYIQKIEQIFPSCVSEGMIDKKALSNLVFGDEKKLALLNEVAHPLIMSQLLKKMDKCVEEVIFAEVPLLFEGNYENLFDKVIVVTRNLEERIKSVMERDKISEEEVQKRISSQFDFEDKKNENRLKNCDVIFLKNEEDLSALKNKITQLIF